MTHPKSEDGTPGNGGRQISISSQDATRQITLTKGQERMLLGTAAALALWTITASAGFLISLNAPSDDRQATSGLVAAYEARIAALNEENARMVAAAEALRTQHQAALAQIDQKQMSLIEATKEQSELAMSLDAMRDKLARTVRDRDHAEARAGELQLTLASLEKQDDTSPEQAKELQVVLSAVSGALQSAVRTRDTQKRDMSRLESEIASMELRMQINADRQERMVATLEDAVATSFQPLETMFRNSGMDVDSLINSVRRNYSGVGGPLTEAAVHSHFDDPETAARFETLMSDMDRMNMMRIAATKIPYAMPVRAAHRFTSGFGTRRDPRTGGRRAHNGIDLAGPRGTHIVASGDGVVTFAGRQSGFGNLIKIRHDYGFETLYAHLNKIRVKVGDRIARGDHIGDMGTTGRSTGVHLHYEIRQGGKPVNPMTYIKAARNVF